MNVTVNKCNVYKGSISNIDEIRCVFSNIAATFYAYEFGYICIGLISLIIFISIFGGIKHNYKWFILNQAIWDLFVSYRFICENGTSKFVNRGSSQPTCIYTSFSNIIGGSYFSLYLNFFFISCIINNPYSSLLLITGSRFIAIYYMDLYDKFTRGRRIIWTLIIFNFVACFFELWMIFAFLRDERSFYLLEQCKAQEQNFTQIFCNDQKNLEIIYSTLQILYKIFIILSHLKPLICLFLSIIATVMLILRLIKQAKFQKKHNPKDFQNSTRITVVIFFQTLINLFVLILESLKGLIQTLPPFFNINILHSQNYVEGKEYPGYIDLRLPLWLGGLYGLTDGISRQMFIQIRVFIESIMVLFIMTGYREVIFDFVKKIYSFMRKPPKKLFQVKSFLRSKTSINETTIF